MWHWNFRFSLFLISYSKTGNTFIHSFILIFSGPFLNNKYPQVMIWCHSEGVSQKFNSKHQCITCASRSDKGTSTILLYMTESSTPQSPGTNTSIPNQQSTIPNDPEIEVVNASPVKRCCCGCGIEASGSHHFCSVTGNRVTHLFIHSCKYSVIYL